MNLLSLCRLGTFWGVILGVVFSVAVLVIGKMDSMMLLSEYPPDIRAKVGPMPEETRRRANQMLFPLLSALILVVVCALVQLRSLTGELKFLETFVVSTAMFQGWNLLDLVLLDGFLLLTLRPAFMILPGTEGMPGYRDCKFHVRKFAAGIVLTTLLALVVTVVTVSVEALV